MVVGQRIYIGTLVATPVGVRINYLSGYSVTSADLQDAIYVEDHDKLMSLVALMGLCAQNADHGHYVEFFSHQRLYSISGGN